MIYKIYSLNTKHPKIQKLSFAELLEEQNRLYSIYSLTNEEQLKYLEKFLKNKK